MPSQTPPPPDTGTGGARTSRIAAALVAGSFVLLLLGCALGLGLYLAQPDGAVVSTETAEPAASEVAPQAPTVPGGAGATWPVPEARELYPHITPESGGEIPSTRHSFYYNGKLHTVEPVVDPAVYWGARNAPQEMAQYEGESDEEFVRAWEMAVICDPQQRPAVESLISQLRGIRDAEGLDSDSYLELIVKYVQSMPYDDARARDDNAPNMFPVELMVERTGVCEEKSRLICLLLMHEGYAVADLQFDAENHAAVGVRGRGPTYGNSGWVFIESTGVSYVSEIPEEFDGGMKLTSEPSVIPIGNGSKTYDSAGEVERILDSRMQAEESATELARKMESQRWSDAEWDAMAHQIDVANEAIDYLWSADVAPEDDDLFKDRAPATAWLDANAWWE